MVRPTQKLHAPLGNFRANKILVTAQYGGVAIEQPAFDESFVKNKQFLSISPLKKLPVLETAEGWLSETNSIARFIARIGSSSLYSGSPSDLAEVDDWLDLIQSELEVPLTQWVYSGLGHIPSDPAVVAQAAADCKRFLVALEQRLKQHPYIIGDRLTLADISAANVLVLGFKLLFDDQFLRPLGNLTRWFKALTASDQFVAVWGPIKFAKVALPMPEPKAKKPAKKEEAKKPAPAKKEEAKKPAPAKQEEAKKSDEETKQVPVEEVQVKKANPLDALPKSSFVLDEWKKLYANTSDKASTLPWFWEHYDPAGYSIWVFKYNKIPGECEVLYRTNNLLNGFLQRMEEFRKYSFGYLGIYGAEPVLDILGCFMWRGTEIAEEMKEHPQIEGFTVTKVDTSDPAQRSLVNDYWGKTEENDLVEGRPVLDGKYWK
jgi:elongation factor 1-gamma